jgi:hypothetical protein
MRNRILSFITLFTSASTLLCCALPALYVTLGLGAAFAGLVTKVPQLIWVSEHKNMVFSFGAVMLIIGGVLLLQAKKMSCPTDPKLLEACKTTRDWSSLIYFISVGLYLLSAFFAFGAGLLSQA